MRILVLDDDYILTMILADHLAERGHRVVPAFDGHLGQIFCEQKSFDLVLINFVLPRHNGIEVMERLRQKSRSTRAIMITGSTELLAEESERMVALDVEAVVEKPFSFSEIDELVENRALIIPGWN
ncbi:MAG: response regulator [Gammaproteobacteria bacterium]|nr:response regulator [Gammaproteobacteria bacterium]